MKKILMLVTAMLLVILCFSACKPGAPTETTAPESTAPAGPTSITIMEDGKFNFVVIRPYKTDNVKLFTTFYKNLKTAANNDDIEIAVDGKSDRPTYEILCGITDTPESQSVLGELGYNNYIIKVIGTKIVIASQSEYALEYALDDFVDYVTENTVDGKLEIPSDYVSIRKRTHGSFSVLTKDIPSPTGFTSCQFSNCDDGYQQATIKGCTKETFDNYKTILASEGFKEYTTSNLGGTEFITYQKDKFTVHAYYTEHNNQMRIIGAKNAVLPSTEKVSYTKTTEPTFTLFGLEKAGSAGGLGCMIGLPDGSFIIVDGGHKTKTEADDIANTLYKLSGNSKKIIIRAWIFTHAHSDHVGAFLQFSPSYSSNGLFTVESFIFNACDTTEQHQYSSTGSFESTRNAINTYWKNATVYKALTGQVFHFPGCDMEVLYTMSDFLPTIVGEENIGDIDKTQVDGNLKNAVFRFFTGDQSIMVTGDASKVNVDEMCKRYGAYLKTDIMTVPHHGHNQNRYRARNGTIEFYKLVDPSIVMWPDGVSAQQSKMAWNQTAGSNWEANYYLVHFLHVKEVIVAGKTTTTVTIPYVK